MGAIMRLRNNSYPQKHRSGMPEATLMNSAFARPLGLAGTLHVGAHESYETGKTRFHRSH
jgi:hypothetical protein